MAGSKSENFLIANIDNSSGLNIFELIQSHEIPEKYWPVRLRVCGIARSEKTESGQPKLNVKVHCVDTEQIGSGIEEVREYCKNSGELPVTEFSAEIEISKLVSALEHLDIVLPNIARIVEDDGTKFSMRS
jgi:hypothetical protein